MIHSGEGARKAGILLMIRKDYATSSSVRIDHVVPGRLVHLRIDGRPCLHYLSVYQHCWNPRADAHGTLEGLLHHREKVWEKLQQTLSRLAWRDMAVVIGDFNTPLPADPGYVGSCSLCPSVPAQTDQPRFSGLLQRFGLRALNTYRRRHKAHTYIATTRRLTVRTQIDFILTRTVHADPVAQQALPLWEVPFVPISGMRHLPLSCSLPRPHFKHIKLGKKPHQTMPHPRNMQQHLRAHPEIAAQFQEKVATALAQAEKVWDLRADGCQTINLVLKDSWEELQAAGAQSCSSDLSQTDGAAPVALAQVQGSVEQ